MPDNDIRQDEPAVPFPDISDYPDFGDDFQAEFTPPTEVYEPPESAPELIEPEAPVSPPAPATNEEASLSPSPEDLASPPQPLSTEPTMPAAEEITPADTSSLTATDSSHVASADLQNAPQADVASAETSPSVSPRHRIALQRHCGLMPAFRRSQRYR
ncbi:hypothetical protein AV650_29020 (plasmid) [Serratia fonticola]|nr:hypothetical protein AV650_29020 [Serratia fonticola]